MKFNAENKNFVDANYPLFLGEPLGIVDTINTTYPQLEDLYQTQLSQIWNEFEVDLRQDKMDMITTPPDIVALMVKTIMWQTVADSVASRSISETLSRYTSNSELGNLLSLWSFFEVIHARTYSHIIKQTFVHPNQMLKELYSEAEVLQRSEIIVKTFDDMEAVASKDLTTFEIKKQIIKTLTALWALESIAFMSSFAVTFAISETKIFQGISQLVKLICRDEVLHTRFDYEIFSILMKDEEFQEALEATKAEQKEILDAVVNQELKWADYLFSEGREIIGLNADLLKSYTLHMSFPLYKHLGLTFEYELHEKNPLAYMEKYINSTKVQSAAQEVQITSYKIGAITDDTDGLDFGDLL